MNKNEPAFPVANLRDSNQADGMTIRDYFAGQALAGFCALQNQKGEWQWDSEGVANSAYEVADAMLAGRNKEIK